VLLEEIGVFLFECGPAADRLAVRAGVLTVLGPEGGDGLGIAPAECLRNSPTVWRTAAASGESAFGPPAGGFSWAGERYMSPAARRAASAAKVTA
jgi:hypothetical protein